MPATSIVGAQWGSEGKGVIASGLAHLFDGAVRTGGPNAGHSLWHNGAVYKMRSVPCAWVNPRCRLYIGAGAVLRAELLRSELQQVGARVVVDRRAVLITEGHEHAEHDLVASIGSTAEGVGEARVSRILRNGSVQMAGDAVWPAGSGVAVGDVSVELSALLRSRGHVMLEGTQGSGLSLLHGTAYPFVTSEDTNEANLYQAAGISLAYRGHTFLVARTFPIRVAGNSGPMGEEITWERMAAEGRIATPEKTTVTKRIRRIAMWDDQVVQTAARINQPCGVWITFGDYLEPGLRGQDTPGVWDRLGRFVDIVESLTGAPVLGIGMGPAADGRWVVAQANMFCAHNDRWPWVQS